MERVDQAQPSNWNVYRRTSRLTSPRWRRRFPTAQSCTSL